MFQNSVSSDLLSSLVNWLNTDNTLDWYYVTGVPASATPGEPLGIVELIEPTIQKMGDGTIVSKYRIGLTVEYYYNVNDGVNQKMYESIKALSWLGNKASKLVKYGYDATFSNGETHRKLFSGAEIVLTRFEEPRSQDSLIQSACQIVLTWEQAWHPQPKYLI